MIVPIAFLMCASGLANLFAESPAPAPTPKETLVLYLQDPAETEEAKCTCTVIRRPGEVGKYAQVFHKDQDTGAQWEWFVLGWGVVRFGWGKFRPPMEVGWWDNVNYKVRKGECEEDCETPVMNCGVKDLSGTYHNNFNPNLASFLSIQGTFGTDDTIAGGDVLQVHAHGFSPCNGLKRKYGRVALTVGGVDNIFIEFKCNNCVEEEE